MSLSKDLSELVNSDVITPETADRIQDYYEGKKGTSTNRLFIVFGVIGALLIGLGIISIIAHNWDELSRITKTFFAFFPLVTGQLLCGYVLLKKPHSTAWRESSAILLFFAVGACISLISQIYNIPGNLEPFLLTWMLLCLPLIYIMKSSAVSLLYIAGITYYAGETGYWSYPNSESLMYWLLLLGALPHYYLLYINRPKSNFTIFHHWFIPLSVVITLGTLADTFSELIFIAYFCLFGLFSLTGNSSFLSDQKLASNSYKIIGSLGTVVLLLILSFSEYWMELSSTDFPFFQVIISAEFIASVVLAISAATLLYLQQMDKSLTDVEPTSIVFILFIIVFFVGLNSLLAVILINLILFALGILIIRDGAIKNNLGRLNYGMIILTALIFSRFFDTDISFILRGLLFVFVGAGFIFVNYRMLKKGKLV